jgi:hypothetical protein
MADKTCGFRVKGGVPMSGLNSANALAVTGAFEAMWLEDMGAEFSAGETSHGQFAADRELLATLLDRRDAEASKLKATSDEIGALMGKLNLDCVNFRQAVGIAKGRKSPEYKRVPKMPGGGTKSASSASTSSNTNTGSDGGT